VIFGEWAPPLGLCGSTTPHSFAAEIAAAALFPLAQTGPLTLCRGQLAMKLSRFTRSACQTAHTSSSFQSSLFLFAFRRASDNARNYQRE